MASKGLIAGRLDRKNEKAEAEARRKQERPRLQGEGRVADLALLEAMRKVTGRTSGALIVEGINLVHAKLTKAERDLVAALVKRG